MSRASTLAKAIGADGAIAVSGNTTLGDASTDTVTFNAATASIPNGINFTNGNFGIGATPSAWRSINKALQIGTVASIANIDSTNNSGVDFGSNMYFDSTGTARYLISSAASSFIRQQGGAFSWNTAGSGTAGNAITFTNTMNLDASGRLGVGVASPTFRLEVSTSGGDGASFTNGAAGQALRLSQTSTNPVIFRMNNSSNNFWDTQVNTDNSISWDYNDSERIRIDSSGKLLVGSSSSIGSSNAQFNDAGGQSAVFNSSSSSGSYVGWFNSGSQRGYIGSAAQLVGGASANNFAVRAEGDLILATSSFERARINASGQLLVGTSSDQSGIGNAQLGVGSMGIRTYQASYNVTTDTGIPINQGSYGGTALLMMSGHVSNGTATHSALYLIKFYYDGNNTPGSYFISGDNIVTVGKSASNTLTLYSQTIPTYTIIMCT